MLENIFFAILFIGGGIAVLKFRKQIKGILGPIASVEHYLGRGSTYLVIIICAFGMIYVGTQFLFGTADYSAIK